jgi:hypothetical protein
VNDEDVMECPGRTDGMWHKFENVFMLPAHTCLYCGISDAEAWSS